MAEQKVDVNIVYKAAMDAAIDGARIYALYSDMTSEEENIFIDEVIMWFNHRRPWLSLTDQGGPGSVQWTAKLIRAKSLQPHDMYMAVAIGASAKEAVYGAVAAATAATD